MSFVQPPNFSDLVGLYGSAKNAVKQLSERFSAEEIARRHCIPYHMVQVYLHDADVTCPARFNQVSTLFSKLDILKSAKGKATEIITFSQTSDIPYEQRIRFLLGRINGSPTYIREAYCLKAIALSGKLGESQINQLYTQYGDVGDVALMCYDQKPSVLLADEVFQTLNLLPNLKTNERLGTLASLLSKATPEEAKWIARLVTRDLKIRLSERMVISCVAKAFQVNGELLLEACTTIGVIDALLNAPKGNFVLTRYRLKPSLFVKPMLAYVYEPDKTTYPVRAEYKFDGRRLQIHKYEDRFWLYSRKGLERSAMMPAVVETAKTFQAQSCIIDAENVAVTKEGAILPFQEVLNKGANLTIKAFDILYCNGVNLMTQPLATRLEYLFKTVPPQFIADGQTCRNEAELSAFYQQATEKGLEGIMVKALNSPYIAGERTHVWQKLKPERDALDCVVIKAFYGHGHRAGLYSSFLLAVRANVEKKLYTVGKVSSLPDASMISLKDRFDRLKTRQDQDGVWVRPEVVMEVIYGEIQESPEYTSGFALRFPNVNPLRRIRDDKTVADIDTLDHLQALYEAQAERYKQNQQEQLAEG